MLFSKMEIGNWKLETRKQILENRNLQVAERRSL